MTLSQDKKRKYQVVTLLFSLLLGVGLAAFGSGPLMEIKEDIFGYNHAIGTITLSLILAGFSWLSIHLAFAQWKNSHWMLLAMKMVLYFCGMITVPFLILFIMTLNDYHHHPGMELGVMVVPIYWFVTVSLFAIILIIPFGFLSYWLSRPSSTKSQENQLISCQTEQKSERMMETNKTLEKCCLTLFVMLIGAFLVVLTFDRLTLLACIILFMGLILYFIWRKC